MTRTVEDAAILLQAIAGYDPKDVDSREMAVADYGAGLDESTKAWRAGVARKFFFQELDAEVEALVEGALNVVASLTSGVQDITIPVDADRTVHVCEAWAYHQGLVAEAADKYQPETLRRIRRGEGVSAEAYIGKRRELETLRRSAKDLFADVDVVITPTSPVPAPTIAEMQKNPDDLRRRELILLRNTRPFNVLGLPTISVPCGFTRAGLPVGLQITGGPGADATVLSVAHAYEQATQWHKRLPKLD
jgi:aspartyl-tRNA(Asn)/glutamyl-tRNA(Gln) amidotransferase subunit A